MSTRRNFLESLLGATIGGIVLKEIPRGREFISLYTPSRKIITYEEIVAGELNRVYRVIPTLFDRDDVFYRLVRRETDKLGANFMSYQIPVEIE